MNRNKSLVLYRMLLFFLFPIAAFGHSVRRIHIKEHFWIVLLFALFFCYTYIPILDSDATRYVERFGSLKNYGLRQYWDDIKNMYDGSGEYQDAYVYTIQLVVSPFTSDIRVYRLVLGFIYFYTFLSLIKHVILNNPGQRTKFNWFIIGFVFIISFGAGINGIRWPLAFMVFLLGSYRYIITPHIKFIFLASLSALIHFMFFYSIIFLFIYILTKKYYNPKITILLILGTLIAGTLISSAIRSNLGAFGEGVEANSLGYIENENWKELRVETFQRTNWYVQLQRTAPYVFVSLALFLTTYFSFNLKLSDTTVALQYFALISFLASLLSAQLVVGADNRYAINTVAAGFI